MLHPPAARSLLRTAVSIPDDVTRLTRLETQLPPLLSVIAGMVDVLGYFLLGHVFTAHVTGNLVVVAASIARGGPWSPSQALTMPVFVMALGAAWVFARLSRARSIRLAYQLLVVQFLLIAIVFLSAVTMHPSAHPDGPIAVTTAMIAVCAMATQYAVFRLAIPYAVSTAAMTGNLTNVALSLVDRFLRTDPLMTHDDDRLIHSLRLIGGFFVGCVVAAAAIPLLGDWASLLPVLLAAGAIVLVATINRSTSNTQGK